MSKFFEDVGDIITSPVKQTYGFLTGNPKYNSAEDLYNHSLGPSNPIADSFNNEGLHKASRLFSAPSWDALGKPAQAFSDQIDTNNSILPASWRPYAQPVEAAVLSAFNPFAGAAYSTAYNAGKNQAQPGSFDWGALGKDAAINFGTAGVAQGAKSLALGAAKSAKAAQDAATLSNFNSALPGGGGSAALNTTINAAKNSTQGALSAFGSGFAAPAGATLSALPSAVSFQSAGSGIKDAAYQAGLKSAPTLANDVLTQTLAPASATPIAGAMDNFGSSGGTDAGTSQWGDVLNAFGGNEVNTPNSEGYRINSDALNEAAQRLGANTYLQQTQARDSALPAGQFQAPLNTPYANRLSNIDTGANQSYKDLVDQVNNANQYYSIIDSNPGLTSDQLNQYLKDPSSGVLGQFQVPQDQASIFQNIRPLGPSNMSLL